MSKNTLFDKIWDAHIVQQIEDGPTQLYIDRMYCHEVTSPQAFAGMKERGLKCFRPANIICMPDHNTPSDQQERIDDPVGRKQVETLAANCAEFGIRHFAMGTKDNGIIHVVGPEKALSLPGMTIVCGDSHTSTHGAVGAIAMGIGTSEVAQVLASQTILQSKPKTMRINIEGELAEGVTAKDVAEVLARDFGITVDKRKITMSEQIRSFGIFPVEVRLYSDIIGKFSVVVHE